MNTVRDLGDLARALKRRATHIEARGPIADDLAAGRQAAAIAIVALGSLLAALGLFALSLLRVEYAAALTEPVVPAAILGLLVLCPVGAFALRRGGRAVFTIALRYDSVHRSHGVVVLRRRSAPRRT